MLNGQMPIKRNNRKPNPLISLLRRLNIEDKEKYRWHENEQKCGEKAELVDLHNAMVRPFRFQNLLEFTIPPL